MPSPCSRFYSGDCLEILPTLPAESVQHIVTSALYKIGWAYGDDGASDRRPLADYLDFLTRALVGCYRVLRPGGVLQFADIANGRPVPTQAMRDIDLWTG